jgi:hypothetical protein
MIRCLLSASMLLAVGCQMTPIPNSIEKWHSQAKQGVPLLTPVLQEGDVLFRFSNTPLAGGLVDFSQTVADATESDFSHAALVYRVSPDGIVVLDVSPVGISRRFLSDWYHDGTRNVVVRRLRPEYRYLTPQVLAEADRLVERDVLYDQKFVADDDRYYCTEMVDHCFRATGHPLADRIRIKDFPKKGMALYLISAIGRIDLNNPVVVAGNERIGLFSSPMLDTVLDLRTLPAGRPSSSSDAVLASDRPASQP